MKKLLLLITMAAAIVSACSKYDDSKIWNELNSLDGRVEKLETLCNQMNTNILSLQAIVAALQQNETISNVYTLPNGEGYTITFSTGKTITIYNGTNGKDGVNGSDGKDGKDGKDGVNGKDGGTPVVGVKKDTDGVYYWTLNGEWLTDEAGDKIKAVGVTPRLKVENACWYVSYDEGVTWIQLGKDSGDGGILAITNISKEDGYVIFTLSDGSTIRLKEQGTYDEDDFIDFEDLGVKAICLYHWDTDGDGELSYKEAASVKSLLGIETNAPQFYGNAQICCFDELKYFTGVTRIEGFSKCGLYKISLPTTANTICTGAFRGNVNRIISMTIGENFISLKKGSLAGKFRNMYLLISDYQTDGYPFDGADIINLYVAKNVLTNQFYGAGITNCILQDGVTSVASKGFYESTVSTVSFPESLEYIGESAFEEVGLKELCIGKNVNQIGSRAFYGNTEVDTIYIKAPTPPAVGSKVFYGKISEVSGTTLYYREKIYCSAICVPSESVEQYKAASGWSEYKNYIVGYDFDAE